MFLFRDVIDQLGSAEASLISLSDPKTGVVPPANYNKVLMYLNTALSDLFTRFTLTKGECVIQTTEGKYSYELVKANAISQDSVNGFILDSVELPFDHEVLDITGVFTTQNRALPFNVIETYIPAGQVSSFSAEQCVRVFNSPKYKFLRTPVGLKDSQLIVRYKTGHKPFEMIAAEDLATFDPDSIVIDLPYVFLMPVIYFICSRATNARGSQRAGNVFTNDSSNYFSKYLQECQTIESHMNLAEEITTPIDTFAMRGFV